MRRDKLNPDLMIGDEITVIDVDSSFGTMNTAERFKDYVVTAIKQSNQTQETYYDIKPMNETDEELLGRMLAGGGMIRREHLYPTDTWMLRKGFLRGEHLTEDKMDEVPLSQIIGDNVNNEEFMEIIDRFPESLQRELLDERPNPEDFVEEFKNYYLNTQQPIYIDLQDELNKHHTWATLERTPQDVVDAINDKWDTNFESVKVYDPNPSRYFKYAKFPGSTAKPSLMVNGEILYGVARFVAALLRGDETMRVWDITNKENLHEHNQPGLNPDLEVGDIIRVIDVDGEHAQMPDRFGMYKVYDVRQDNATQEFYYQLSGETSEVVEDSTRTTRMFKPRSTPTLTNAKYLYRGDTWIHGNIPMATDVDRKTISEQRETELNPELEVGDTIRIIDIDRERESGETMYTTPPEELRPEMLTPYTVVKKESAGHKAQWPFKYIVVREDKVEEYEKNLERVGLRGGATWERLLYPWIYQWIYATKPIAINEQDDVIKSNTPGAPDRTPFTKLETTILKQLHKNLTKDELQKVSEETPYEYDPTGKKFWAVMKLFGIVSTDAIEDTRASIYAKWALDNWTEDGDYGSIERPIKEKLAWYDVQRSESGSQIEYKDGNAEVLGFDEDDAGERADFDFYAWGGEMETTDYGDYETYDSQLDQVTFNRVDEGLTPQMVEELKGPKETQDLLFNFWKNHGPTLDPDRLKLIGFNMDDADDRTKVEYNLVAYYGDEELINIITDRLEGIQDGPYKYMVTSIDFHDLLNFKSYPLTIMVDVVVDGSTEVPLSTEDGIIDITLWEANERAHKEWRDGGGGPYDGLYEEVREQVLGDINILLENLPVEAMLDYLDFTESNDPIDIYARRPEIITEEDGDLEDLVYIDEPREKHIKKMEKGLGEFEGFPIEDFMNTPPPKNESDTTEDEIEHIESLPVDDEFVDSTDDIDQHFKKFLKEKDLEYPESNLEDIMKGVKNIILNLKYHYNRPRPGQVADKKNLNLNPTTLDSASTPSYPSGHATQGRFIGNYLSDLYPEYREEISKLGYEIGQGRLMAKVHYPSDQTFGIELGDALYNFLQNKETTKEEMDIIIKDDNHKYEYKDYDDFINYVIEELSIENPPTVWIEKEPSSEYTGGTYRYKGGSERIKVRSKGRSLIDILRSLAHELVHHKQKEEGKFDDEELVNDIPEIGGPIEDEANAIAGRLIKKYGKENEHLYEQVMVKKGDMLKSDVFKFLSNRFTLTPTDYSEIKDVDGNYYRIIDMENPYESVNLSSLLEPTVEMVSYGIKSGVFEEEDIQKAIEAVTDWLSLSMNQEVDLMN